MLARTWVTVLSGAEKVQGVNSDDYVRSQIVFCYRNHLCV